VIKKMELIFNPRASLEKAMKSMATDLVKSLGEKYGFNGEEALASYSIVGKAASSKRKREVSKYPFPFVGDIREGCVGIRVNRGLYTQCERECVNGEEYCGGCKKEKGEDGLPKRGNVMERKAKGDEYRDEKGRKPVHYSKIMQKLKVSREEVLAEAAKFGVTIEDSHFEAEERKKRKSESQDESKKRGRPKKEEKVLTLSNATEDLFASLMKDAKAAAPEKDESSVSSLDSDGSDEEAAVKKLVAKEKAKMLKKKAAKLAAKAEAAAKDAAKDAAKKAKEEEKAAKEAAKKAKEEEKKAKEEEKKAKEANDAKAEELESESDSESEVSVHVKKFVYRGKTYLRSSDNILYDSDQDVIGRWNEKKQCIEKTSSDSSSDEEEE